MKFTACYTKLEHGYMGQLLEWTNVITEGNDLEDCEEMLKDAAHEMMLAYQDEGLKIPHPSLIVKPISILIDEEMLEDETRTEEALLANAG
ncbi:MAG: type II toxin-antitoxin system HicB family antitoxin [Synergistaceae bacterium]|nr:type II toxin-antitoxin system HicB family antitoxin [Synergistaceae bacterium]